MLGGDRLGTQGRVASAIYVADSTARLALSGIRDGQLVVEIDTNKVYSWDLGTTSFIEIGAGSSFITSISDTDTVDLTETAGDLTADVKYQDSDSVNLSDDASGLKADVVIQDSNSVDLSVDASGLKADVLIQDTTSVDLAIDASGLKADVLPAGVDHNALANTHNLNTDIDHNQLTNYSADEHFTMIDDDTFATASSSTAATSESIKEYVDNSIIPGTDEKVKCSSNDTTSKYLEDALTVSSGSNTTNILERTTSNDGSDEDVNIQIDESKIDHANIGGLQGGTTDEYYHLTLAQHTDLTSGTNDSSETLTNKSIDSDNNTITNIVNADIKAAAAIAESKLDLDYSTDSLNTAVGTKQADVITTRGDIVRGSSSNAAERLALGTEGQILISDGTDIAWEDATAGAGISSVSQTTHGFSVLDPVYFDGTDWNLGKADAAATVATHLVSKVKDANTFDVIQFGPIEATAHGLTSDYYYVSNATAGDLTDVEPITGYSNPALQVLDANNVYATMYRPSTIADGIASDSEIGFIQPYAGTSLPVGFLACEGQAVSRSTYSKLYSVIGTTWGAGDGSTTFNLPDARSGFLVGAGTGTKFTVNTDRSVGDYDDDQIQGHRHANLNNPVTYLTGISFGEGANANSSYTAPIIGDPTTDGTNGTPRTGDETKPNSLAVKYCIRYSPKGALQGVYAPEIVVLKDIKSSGTAGGASSTSWTKRTLNTTENTQSWCSLASDVITLQAGTYHIKGNVTGYATNYFTCRLRNTTDSTDDITGTMAFAGASTVDTMSLIEGVITITSAKNFELQMIANSATATNGFGSGGFNTGVVNTFSMLSIHKIGE